MGSHLRRTGLLAAIVLLVVGLLATVSTRDDEGSGAARQPAGSGAQSLDAVRLVAERCTGARAFKTQGCTVATRSGSYQGSFGERSSLYERGCIAQPPNYPMKRCSLTQGGSVRMALVGNSKASQWADTLAAAARGRGWQVSTYVASGCPPNALRSTDPGFASKAKACQAWGRKVQRDLLERGVRYVVFSASASVFRNRNDPSAGFAQWLEPLVDAGVGVVVVRSTVNPLNAFPKGTTVSDCLRKNRTDYRRCAGARDKVVSPDPVMRVGRTLQSPLVRTVSMTDLQCTASSCPMVVGRVLAYYDGIHMTPPYAMSTLPWFRSRVGTAVKAIAEARQSL